MAEYEIDVLPEIKMIKVTVTGTLDMDTLCEISRQTRVLSNENHYHILCDMRGAVPDMSAMQLSMMSKQVVELKTADAKSIKAVVICNEEKGLGKWQFLEYVQQAMNLHTRVFTQFGEAVEWLAEIDADIEANADTITKVAQPAEAKQPA